MNLYVYILGEDEVEYALASDGRAISCARFIKACRETRVPEEFRRDSLYSIHATIVPGLVQVWKQIWTLADVAAVERWLLLLIEEYAGKSTEMKMYGDLFPEAAAGDTPEGMRHKVTTFLDFHRLVATPDPGPI